MAAAAAAVADTSSQLAKYFQEGTADIRRSAAAAPYCDAARRFDQDEDTAFDGLCALEEASYRANEFEEENSTLPSLVIPRPWRFWFHGYYRLSIHSLYSCLVENEKVLQVDLILEPCDVSSNTRLERRSAPEPLPLRLRLQRLHQ